jgi:hypothetical protein
MTKESLVYQIKSIAKPEFPNASEIYFDDNFYFSSLSVFVHKNEYWFVAKIRNGYDDVIKTYSKFNSGLTHITNYLSKFNTNS